MLETIIASHPQPTADQISENDTFRGFVDIYLTMAVFDLAEIRSVVLYFWYHLLLFRLDAITDVNKDR
jgi:hypothetical protein